MEKISNVTNGVVRSNNNFMSREKIRLEEIAEARKEELENVYEGVMP